jgi:hypothetical protein
MKENLSMKYFVLTSLFVLLVATPASSQWRQGNELAGDTPVRKFVNGFGGNLIVVEDPNKFVQDWQKPETPKITLATEVKRGVTVGVMVLFAGCKADARGDCNADVDYLIYKPDGTIYTDQKGQPLWHDAAPPSPIIQLGRAILGLRLAASDPIGEYRIKAKLTDHNANISFELETKFKAL